MTERLGAPSNAVYEFVSIYAPNPTTTSTVRI